MVTVRGFLVLLFVGACLQSHGASAGDDCPMASCMDKKIDVGAEMGKRVNVTRDENGVRMQFQPKFFTFLCSVNRLMETCLSGLTSQELDKCIEREEQQLYTSMIRTQKKIVCSKDERLDKLVDCMNNEAVQRLFFDDLVVKVGKFKSEIEKNNSICSEMKSEIRKAVTTLSDTCDHDGLRALLEGINELVVEFENEIVNRLPKHLSRDDICLDEFKEVTETAQTSLSRRVLPMKTSRIIGAVLGL